MCKHNVLECCVLEGTVHAYQAMHSTCVAVIKCTYSVAYIVTANCFVINHADLKGVFTGCVILVQVNDNGVISFNSPYNVRTPLSLPLDGTEQIIAPYWADVDTREVGQIFYRPSTDPTLLARASQELQAAFPRSQNLAIRALLIATWVDVGYFSQNGDKVSTYVYSRCTHNACKFSYHMCIYIIYVCTCTYVQYVFTYIHL